MPYIAPEVVQQAKRMDLLTYLKNYEPYELVRFSGNTYTTKTHDSLKISNGKWMWWSRGIGGRSALDYLIKVRGYTFMEAVQSIAGQAAIQPPVSLPAEQRKSCSCRSLTDTRPMLYPTCGGVGLTLKSLNFAYRPGGFMRAGITTMPFL